jgi:hypothetical protein
MAGNFMKYGAKEAAFGSKNAGDLPVERMIYVGRA